MNETYELRRFRVAPGEWESFVERLRAAAGAPLFGVWRGQIGLEANEGLVLTAWADEETLAAGARTLAPLFARARESHAERLIATLRPDTPAPPERRGVYAFREFELAESDWSEFASLSERAWPGFESGYDAKICGFFRSLDVASPAAKVLLLTRYASLATWEASRADVSRDEFQRRHKLTRSTRVVTATPA